MIQISSKHESGKQLKTSDDLKHVEESTDQDLTLFCDHEIKQMVGIMITRFRFFELFSTKNWDKKWSKSGPFFNTFLGQKLDHFRTLF